jgi:hypothetical protein
MRTEPIAAPTPKLSSTTPPAPVAAAALSVESAATRTSEAREPPLERRRLGPRRHAALDRPEGQLGDQEEPGGVDRGEPVERRALRREEHGVLAAERRKAQPESPGPAYDQAEGEQEERDTPEPEREQVKLEVLRGRKRREAGRRKERDRPGR